jgi:tetratricopeptide (TPR) repeat protein
MKRFRFFCCVVALGVSTFLFADKDESFLLANQAYKSGDFNKAYELYEKLPEKNAAIYYNLGNCAYQQGKYGYALLNWRRAERDWGFFGREELSENMKLIRKKISACEGDQKDQGPLVNIMASGKSLKNACVSAIRATPIIWLQILVLLLWIVLFGALRYLFRHKYQVIITLLFTIQVLAAGMLALKYNYTLKEFGVIVEKTASFMSGPGKTYTQIMLLPEAKECVILKESDGYYKVKTNGSVGWVQKSAIGVI